MTHISSLCVHRPMADDITVLRNSTGHLSLAVGPISIIVAGENTDQSDLAIRATAMRVLAERARELADELTARVVQVSPYAEQVTAAAS